MELIDVVEESNQKPDFNQPPMGFNFGKNFLILLGNVILGAFLAALFSFVIALSWGYDFTELASLLSGFDPDADASLLRWILMLNQAFTFLLPGLLTAFIIYNSCLLYTSPSPRDKRQSRMPSSA